MPKDPTKRREAAARPVVLFGPHGRTVEGYRPDRASQRAHPPRAGAGRCLVKANAKKLKDERPTVALARYSSTLLQAALLDRAIDRAQAEIDRLEDCIAAIERRNERRLAERKRLRERLDRERAARKGGTP